MKVTSTAIVSRGVPAHVTKAVADLKALMKRVHRWPQRDEIALFTEEAREALRQLSSNKKKTAQINESDFLNMLKKSEVLSEDDLKELSNAIYKLRVAPAWTFPDNLGKRTLNLWLDLYGDMFGFAKESALRKALVDKGRMPETCGKGIATQADQTMEGRRKQILSREMSLIRGLESTHKMRSKVVNDIRREVEI